MAVVLVINDDAGMLDAYASQLVDLQRPDEDANGLREALEGSERV